MSYAVRQEVFAQIALRYQKATGEQKTLQLDRAVGPTGYGRKYALRSLSHIPERTACILRSRRSVSGPTE